MGNLTYELPTYELRARLDKLGVEWTYANGTVRFNDGRRWFRAWAYNDDLLCVSMGYLTPEQAIAATVGVGTCHMEVKDNLDETEGMGDVWLDCDKCHLQMMLEPTTPRFKYCPNCGARIEEESE